MPEAYEEYYKSLSRKNSLNHMLQDGKDYKNQVSGNLTNPKNINPAFSRNDFSDDLRDSKSESNKIFGFNFSEKALDIKRIKNILMLELLMIIDSLFEGSDKMPSIFGLKK